MFPENFEEIFSEVARLWTIYRDALVELWEQIKIVLPPHWLELLYKEPSVKSLRNLTNRERRAEYQRQQRMATARGRGIVRRADDR